MWAALTLPQAIVIAALILGTAWVIASANSYESTDDDERT